MISLYPTYCERIKVPLGGFGTTALDSRDGMATVLRSTEYRLKEVDMDGVATIEFNYPPQLNQQYIIIPRIVDTTYLIGDTYYD